MAFDIKKISPLDLQPRKAVGVSIPFSSKSVFTSTYTTQDAIKSNLINYLLTNQGERYLNPTFGANIRALLFEQMGIDVKDTIDSTIRSGINIWFNNITIDTLTITDNPDTNTIVIYMKYKVDFSNISDEILINFQQ
jgi:phage baseplate assembly protein W